MDKKPLSKISMIKKWPFLRITIFVIGGLVIFGLGFSLGLHYAQNLYLVKEKSLSNKPFHNKFKGSFTKASDEFSFYYGLKKSNQGGLRKNENGLDLKENKGGKDAQKTRENREINSHKNISNPYQSGYTIQVYSFKSKEISEKKISELKQRGYPAYQSEIDFGGNEILYRVRIGNFKKRDDAKKILEKLLESENREAYITRY